MEKTDRGVKIFLIILSLFLLWIGNRTFGRSVKILDNEGDHVSHAKVLSVAEMETFDGGEGALSTAEIPFRALITSGPYKGREVEAVQNIIYRGPTGRVVREGDKILLYRMEFPDGRQEYAFSAFYRLTPIFLLGAFFAVLLLIFGRSKGLYTLIALLLSVLSIFFVFIPSILGGWNIYVGAVAVCIYSILITILLTNGLSKKSLATIIGCTFGVVIAGLMTLYMDPILELTGVVDETSVYLSMFNSERPIDLRGIVFASILIGSLGAVMDVAMDISSALYEIKTHAPQIRYWQLVKSGLNVGQDLMGTMANTLILAYIGGGLSGVLSMSLISHNLSELLNREGIIVEFLQGLIGSTAILLTIPMTALVASLVYIKE